MTALGPTLRRIAGFSILTLGLAWGNPTRLASSLPGDPGDANLILALLGWGGDRAFEGFSGYWDGPMYHTGRDVMAYTDLFLPLTIPFEVIARLTGSNILAFNLLYLASWVLCGEATYRLAVRIVPRPLPAFVAATAFTFASIRLSLTNHFQLAWAGFIPLTLLAWFRFHERPTPIRGTLVAVALATTFTISAYYGLVLVLGIGGLAALELARSLRPASWRELVPGYGALGGTTLALFLPLQHWYSSAEACAPERDVVGTDFALEASNFLSVAPRSTLLAEAPIVGDPGLAASGENHAYVGLFVLVFATVAVLVALRRRRLPDGLRRPDELASIAAIGAATAIVAAGPLPALGRLAPYAIASRLVPGVDSILALGRFAIFVQLALVLVAAVGLSLLLDVTPTVPARVAVALVLVGIISLEGLHDLPSFDPPPVAADSIHGVLADLPGGVAAELPAPARSATFVYAFTESIRMARGIGDGVTTINGYSGFAPTGYDALIDDLNDFPSQRSIDALERSGTAYVALHGEPVRSGDASVDDVVAASGLSSYTPEEVERLVEEATAAGIVDTVVPASDGVVLVLDPDRFGRGGGDLACRLA